MQPSKVNIISKKARNSTTLHNCSLLIAELFSFFHRGVLNVLNVSENAVFKLCKTAAYFYYTKERKSQTMNILKATHVLLACSRI